MSGQILMRQLPGTAPDHDEIATLAGVIRDGDLTAARAEALAALIEELGSAVRVACRLVDRQIDPLWRPIVAKYCGLVRPS